MLYFPPFNLVLLFTYLVLEAACEGKMGMLVCNSVNCFKAGLKREIYRQLCYKVHCTLCIVIFLT